MRFSIASSKRGLVFCLFILPLFSACSAIPTTMLASTSPLPPGVRGTIPAFGSDCQYYLLGIIPVTSSPNSQSALTAAKEDADVDVLTDVTVDHGGGYYILFSNLCVRVRGQGVERSVLSSYPYSRPVSGPQGGFAPQ